MINIYIAEQKDYPIIQDIANQTWYPTFQDILSVEQIKYMLEMMYSITSISEQVRQQGHIFLLAQEGTNNIGYASYETNYKDSEKTKIHKIYVLPTTQGKGVGKKLIQRIEEIAIQAGNSILTLNVNRNNNAVRFYEKIGFAKIGTEDIDIGNGFLMEDFIMDKKITEI
ncbi:MAG: GNAT family N-acetyltransferase [Thermoflexibacter sp.]|jgi:ribosomal protein S18 acetylase RimI-like enzyme|nr:GNAT family N-acetyltransferase [Thermoflexibacter sp.]